MSLNGSAMLSLTEAPAQPKSEMAMEMERRIAATNPTPSTPEVPATSATNEVPKTVSGAKGTDVTGAAETPTPPATPPTANAGQDVSFVPESVRSWFEKAPPEVLAYTREKHFKAEGFTQKTMALAEERKQIEARKMAADYGELILKDKNLRRLVEDAAEAETPKPTPFDPLSATPEEIEAHDSALKKDAVAEALRIIEERDAAKRGQVEVLSTMANAAHAEFVASGEYDDAAVNAAYDALESRGVKFSPENVVATLRLMLPKKQPAPKASPPAPVPSQVEANGASALTRGAGVSAPLKVPGFILEQRQPVSYEEKRELAVYLANQIRAREGRAPITT